MPEPNLLPLFVYPVKTFALAEKNGKKCKNNPELLIDSEVLPSLSSLTRNSDFFVDLDKARDEYNSKDLPQARRDRLTSRFKLSAEQAFVFVANNLDILLTCIVDKFNVPMEDIPLYTRVLCLNFLHLINLNVNMDKMSLNLKSEKIFSFVNDAIKKNMVSKRVAVKLFVDLFNQEQNINKLTLDIIREKNMFIVKDVQVINQCIQKLFELNVKAVNEYKQKTTTKSREKIFDFFVGRVHKNFNEFTDPDLVDKLVLESLKKLLK